MVFCVTNGASWSQRSIGENAREVSEGIVFRVAIELAAGVYKGRARRQGRDTVTIGDPRGAATQGTGSATGSGRHTQGSGLVSKSRQRAIAAHNAKTNVCAHNFDVEDFVLSAVLSRNRKSKLSLQWHDPLRVTKCSYDYVFEVQDLMTDGTCKGHGTQLKFYRNKGLEEDNELHEHLAYYWLLRC
jgi:hypothetical protein